MVDKFKFMEYLSIRNSGKTNMFDISRVCALSYFGLTKEDCLDIMKNFKKYEKKWPEEE